MDPEFEKARAALAADLDARLASFLRSIETVVHDQVLAVLRDEGYREIVRRVWDEKIGDSRGSWAARAVAADMSWRVKTLADALPPVEVKSQ